MYIGQKWPENKHTEISTFEQKTGKKVNARPLVGVVERGRLDCEIEQDSHAGDEQRHDWTA